MKNKIKALNENYNLKKKSLNAVEEKFRQMERVKEAEKAMHDELIMEIETIENQIREKRAINEEQKDQLLKMKNKFQEN